MFTIYNCFCNLAHGDGSNAALSARTRGTTEKRSRGKADVEDRINDLAEILGLPATLLASAISDVVSMHVAPATISSISSSASAAKAEKTAVKAMVGDDSSAEGEGIAAGVAKTMGKMVGFEEPLQMEEV